MQLKRDTDYALRILYCLYIDSSFEDPYNLGLSIQEIARKTGLQTYIIKRLCELLEPPGFIICSANNGFPRLFASKELCNRSLFDVVEAVEGGANLFAVFFPSSLMYKQCHVNFQKTEKKFITLLKRTLLSDLFKTN